MYVARRSLRFCISFFSSILVFLAGDSGLGDRWGREDAGVDTDGVCRADERDVRGILGFGWKSWQRKRFRKTFARRRHWHGQLHNEVLGSEEL